MPKLVDKKRKVEQIGSASIKVFRRLGYHKTRMVDIAEAAGTGKGTLYEYFRNKDEIFQFEFERYFAAFQSGAAAAMASADSPGRRLLSLVRFAIEHMTEWEDHCAVYVDYFGSGQSTNRAVFSLSNIYGEIEDIIRRLIVDGQSSGEFNRDLEPGSTAELLVSLFEGVVLHGVFSERRRKGNSLNTTALNLVSRWLFADPQPIQQTAKTKTELGKRKR